jgi:hypothetical protein
VDALDGIGRADDGFGFDFNEIVRSNEARLDEGVGGTNVAKAFAVDASDGFPVGNVADKDAGANDIVQGAAKLDDGAFDFVNDETRLGGGIAFADKGAAIGGGCARDMDVVANADGARVARDGFKRSAAADGGTVGRVGHKSKERLEIGKQVNRETAI